jgi:hypothetical protein
MLTNCVLIVTYPFQGVFVFLFYVVLNDQVKNYWLEKFGISTASPSKSNASTSKSTAGNVYANTTAKTDDDHTYSTAAEFPAKNENNANI